MLEELSKHDELWRFYALKICGDEDYAKELVNDMYIKVYDCSPEYWTKRYIFRVIKNLFLNDVKSNAKMPKINIDEVYYLKNQDKTDEHLEECLQNMKWFDREILLLTHEFSLRKAQDEVGVYYGVLNYHKNKALKKLKIMYHGKR